MRASQVLHHKKSPSPVRRGEGLRAGDTEVYGNGRLGWVSPVKNKWLWVGRSGILSTPLRIQVLVWRNTGTVWLRGSRCFLIAPFGVGACGLARALFTSPPGRALHWCMVWRNTGSIWYWGMMADLSWRLHIKWSLPTIAYCVESCFALGAQNLAPMARRP